MWGKTRLVSKYFILFAMLVMIDGACLLVMAQSQVAQNVRRTWSRLMWSLPIFLLATVLVGSLIGALEVLVRLALS